MLDIDVPPQVLPKAAYEATGAICDRICAAVISPFTGAELVAALLGQQVTTVPQLVAKLTRLAVSDALVKRACVVVNTSGRVGLTLGYGVVIEPAGREYALTVEVARWSAAYQIPVITYTSTLSGNGIGRPPLGGLDGFGSMPYGYGTYGHVG